MTGAQAVKQPSSKCDVDTWLSGQTDLDGNPLFVSKAYCRCVDQFLEEEYQQLQFHLAGLQGWLYRLSCL